MGLLPFREDVAQIFAHMTRAQQTLCNPAAKRQWMEGHGIGLRKRPREEAIHDVESALARGEWAAAEKEARRLATNRLDGGHLASMAIAAGSFFLRSDSALYRIAERAPSP